MTAIPNDPYSTGQPVDRGQAEGMADTAKDEARNLGGTAVDAARDVAVTAKEQGEQVAYDIRDQARRLGHETRSQLSDQANSGRDRAVGGLRSVSEELRTMAEKADQPGIGSQLARQGADYAGQLADFLAQREPGQLVEEVRRFARRRPGVFLLGAAAAGVLAGRLSRGAIDAGGNSGDPASSAEVREAATSGTARVPSGDDVER